jgi:tetratricopeptide (TPR) repeat protein
MKVFVSHCHKDNAFAKELASGLRTAGADVWYDDESIRTGMLGPVIERELLERPIFIVVLSTAALASRWVEDETRWAYILLRRQPSRILLPILAKALPDEHDIWLFLHDFRRIEAPGFKPFPRAKAISYTLQALQLALPGEAPSPPTPLPSESAADLMMRGKAMLSQGRHRETLPSFQRITQLEPHSFYAWANLGYTLQQLNRLGDSVTAYDRALSISPDNAMASVAWNNKGNALDDLDHPDEALAAYDRALAIDPSNSKAWYNKGWVLDEVKRCGEALDAYDFALTIDSKSPATWDNKGETLNNMLRFDEALYCLDRALELDSNLADAWNNKMIALRALGRVVEAEEAERRTRALGG